MLSSFLLFLDVYGHNPKKKQPTFLIVTPTPPAPPRYKKLAYSQVTLFQNPI